MDGPWAAEEEGEGAKVRGQGQGQGSGVRGRMSEVMGQGSGVKRPGAEIGDRERERERERGMSDAVNRDMSDPDGTHQTGLARRDSPSQDSDRQDSPSQGSARRDSPGENSPGIENWPHRSEMGASNGSGRYPMPTCPNDKMCYGRWPMADGRWPMADGRQSTGGFCGELALQGCDGLQNFAGDGASVSRVPGRGSWGQVLGGACPLGLGEGSREMGRDMGGEAAGGRGSTAFPEGRLPRQFGNRGGSERHEIAHLGDGRDESLLTGRQEPTKNASWRAEPAIEREFSRAYMEIHGFADAAHPF